MMIEPLSLRTAALELDVGLVPWDTESFGVPVAQVGSIVVRDPVAAPSEAMPLQRWLEHGQVQMAACRLADGALSESFLLESMGFRFIEMVYAMRHGLSALPTTSDPDIDWRPADRTDLPQLQSIAAQAFITGRWNVDWRVGAGLGGRRYADWVARSFDNPRQQLLAARVGDRLAGFFIVEDCSDGSSYWHLTAVAEAFQGQGVGKRMWLSMLQRHRAQGRQWVGTTIAARNLPVVNLYARLGWQFTQNQMTFHWTSPQWPGNVPGGAPA